MDALSSSQRVRRRVIDTFLPIAGTLVVAIVLMDVLFFFRQVVMDLSVNR
jgi:hypothetical protein